MIPISRPGFFHGAYFIRNKAQSVIEYAAVIFCIVAALLAMQTYIKRSLQGRLRQAGDNIGQQYSPGNTAGWSRLDYSSKTTTTVETLSERQLYDKYGRDFDLDKDGIPNEDDVFGTETIAKIGRVEDSGDNGKILTDPAVTTQTGEETVGPLEDEEPVF